MMSLKVMMMLKMIMTTMVMTMMIIVMIDFSPSSGVSLVYLILEASLRETQLDSCQTLPIPSQPIRHAFGHTTWHKARLTLHACT